MAKEKIQPVRGMQDILPKEMRRHRKVTETAREVARLYGFEHMATPIMEQLEVFKRTLGEYTDIVNKEMYPLQDRKGKEFVLRPENTASIVRAFVSNSLQQSLPARFFYSGPMFRYERPQTGRQRQFHQIGVELLGESDTLADLDVIACGYEVLNKLGLGDKVKLQLNTLGDSESREKYKTALVDYLAEYEEELSEDSQRRLKTNPLRILDSKDEHDRKIISDAPKLETYLNTDSRQRLEFIVLMLNQLSIPYEMNPYLVRGLDYYCHTVFEFVTDDLGAQGTVLAGGRYDGLVKTLGGNDIEGVGWAAGVERLALMLDELEANSPEISLIAIGDNAEFLMAPIAYKLRNCGVHTDYLYNGNLKKRMQNANATKARFALVFGETEMNEKSCKLKNLASGTEIKLLFPFDIPEELNSIKWMPDLVKILKEYFSYE